MKIAFCFCGEIRTGVYSTPNILNFIGDLLPDTDFFIHTWDKNTFKPRHPRSPKGSVMPFSNYTNNHTIYDIQECLKNKVLSSEVENFDIWYERFGKEYFCFSPQWYSWFKVNQLKKQYECMNNFKYDIVVKTRLDFIVPTEYSLKEEIAHVTKDLNTFYSHGVTDTRINDVFFICSSQVMDIAANFILDVPCKEWYNDVFGDHLKTKNIPVKSTDINMYAIYRPESIPTNPLTDFSKCWKDDQDWYSEK